MRIAGVKGDSPVARATLIQSLAVILGVVAGVLIARLGDASVKGTVAAYASISVIIATIVNLDIPQQALLEARRRSDLGIVRGLLLGSWRIYGAAAAVSLVLASFFAPRMIWLVLGALLYLIAGQAALATNGVSGIGSTSLNALLQQAVMAIGAISLGLAGSLDSDTGKVLLLSSYLIPLPFIWHRLTKLSRGKVASGRNVLFVARRGLRWQPARGAEYLLLRLDLLLVFHFLGSASAGIYSVGFSTAALALLAPTQLAHVVIYRGTQGGDLTVARELRAALLLATGASTVLGATGWWLIPTVYGPEFATSYHIMLLCLPGVIALSAIQPIVSSLRLSDGAATMTVWMSIGLATMIAAAAMTFPHLQAQGIAISASVGTATTAVGLLVAVHRREPRRSRKQL